MNIKLLYMPTIDKQHGVHIHIDGHNIFRGAHNIPEHTIPFLTQSVTVHIDPERMPRTLLSRRKYTFPGNINVIISRYDSETILTAHGYRVYAYTHLDSSVCDIYVESEH